MDTESEKLCLGELDHLILDVGKKVTLIYISNTWFTLSKHAENVLKKWLKNYSGDKPIVKEYLIRGTDAHGNSVITVVPEKSLPKVAEICPNHTQTLYSLEVGSANGKSLNITEPTANKYIALKIKSAKRNIAVNKIVVPPPVKKEPAVSKKPTNIFAAAQSKSKSPNDVKKESNSAKDTAKIKEEKTSPKQNQAAGKASAKGQQGKASSSISSFFAKPSTSNVPSKKHDKSVSDTASKIEKVQIKDEPIETVKNETANTIKRQLSNASDSAEDSKAAVKNQKVQAKKKMKLEPKSARSRVMQICDSSSDEDEAPDRKDTKMECDDEEVVVKKEKENKTPSPEKVDANKSNGGGSSSGGRKRRIKVKKMVTRTYEDDDGFINTIREMEEVSCSEEEPEVVEPPPKKVASAAAAATTNGKSTAPSSKKKISPPAGKKQGSILSFFGKK